MVKRKIPKPLSGLEPPIIEPIAQRCNTELSRLPVVKTGFRFSAVTGILSFHHSVQIMRGA
jgi:hypothetical protein